MSAPSFRAISTPYKGYNFRSRLEARWAVFFDRLGIRWDYEPEGFELGNGLRYLPDFWLPDWKLWVEVKPGAPDDAAREKASRLCTLHGSPVLMVLGMPGSPSCLYIPSDHAADEYAAWAPWGEKTLYIQAPAPRYYHPDFEIYDMEMLDTVLFGDAENAALAARGSRFEFGAKGDV